MKNTQEDKAGRILSLYSRLSEGRVVNKTEEAERYGVSLRTIQRDISDIQNYLQEQGRETGEIQEIIFDRAKNGYRLETKEHTGLSAKEILVAGKIMLEKRSYFRSSISCAVCAMMKKTGSW